MKILVIGASGLVGSHVYEEAKARGHEVVGTYRNYPVNGLTRLDLADEVFTLEFMQCLRPDWVVHAAGWTWVDGCEQDPQRAFRENCEQPAMLASLCKEMEARFAYFSTTYIFDGTKGHYSEEDIPNPINVYGKSKWAAEQKIQKILGGQALIPRVICVWGKEAQQKNFVYQVIKALKEGRVMNIPSDQVGNPTWAGDIAWWLLELMTASERGVWNLAGDQTNCTRMEWYTHIRQALLHLTEIGDITKDEPLMIPTESLNQPAKRPLNSGAVIEKVQQCFTRVLRHPNELKGGMWS